MLTRKKPLMNAEMVDRHSSVIRHPGVVRNGDGHHKHSASRRSRVRIHTSPRGWIRRPPAAELPSWNRVHGGDAIQHRGQRLLLRPGACLFSRAPQSCHRRGVSAHQPPGSQWEATTGSQMKRTCDLPWFIIHVSWEEGAVNIKYPPTRE